MTKVFIGGSRRISRLNPAVRKRLDRIAENGLQVLVGDANGADKAVQEHFSKRHYENVRVFCTEGRCRNNAGDWSVQPVPAPKGAKGLEYYSVKDAAMTSEADVGFMLWDSKSRGTLANVQRLLDQDKCVVIYMANSDRFATLRNKSDLESVMSSGNSALQRSDKAGVHPDDMTFLERTQFSLF